jgi:hypothetical protein
LWDDLIIGQCKWFKESLMRRLGVNEKLWKYHKENDAYICREGQEKVKGKKFEKDFQVFI